MESLPDRPASRARREELDGPVEPVLLHNEVPHTRLVAGADGLLHGGDAGPRRFFRQHVTPELRRRPDMLRVQPRWGADRDHVALHRLEHLLHGGEEGAPRPVRHCPGPVGDHVAAGDEFAAPLLLELRQGVDMVLADPAAAGKGECAHFLPPEENLYYQFSRTLICQRISDFR